MNKKPAKRGPKPINGEVMKPRQFRMTDAEAEKVKALGGAKWVRSKIASAVVVDHRKKTTTLTKIEAKDLK